MEMLEKEIEWAEWVRSETRALVDIYVKKGVYNIPAQYDITYEKDGKFGMILYYFVTGGNKSIIGHQETYETKEGTANRLKHEVYKLYNPSETYAAYCTKYGIGGINENIC